MWWLVMKEKKQRLKNVLVNGSMLQEQLIGFSNGRSNRIRTFTSQELQEATNGIVYSCLGKYRIYIPYSYLGMYETSKGYFLNIPILVKKGYWDSRRAINDIVFASHMSVHKNVLKLLGVCLENKIPFTVYECAEHRSLKDCLLMHPTPSGTNTHQQPPPPPLPWKLRLKIAAQVANVVVYLHTAFSRPIIHRDINVSSILLDQQNVAKLFDFSLCIPIPEGEVRVEADYVAGTTGYLAPEYISTCSCSEKSDVFNFGYLLLMLLTARTNCAWWDVTGRWETLLDRARRSVKDNRIADIVDPRILAQPFAGCPGMNQQLERFAELALSCAAHREEDRPEMIDVEKQLWQMEQSSPNTCATVISEAMP